MKNIVLLFILFSTIIVAQEQTSIEFQEELNNQYGNNGRSPLLDKDREAFKGLPFFKINNKYKVEANFEKSSKPATIEMKTSTDRKPVYDIFGIASFQINGIDYKLNIYQINGLKEEGVFESQLFLPFTDATNGSDTYGGGRYIDLTIPTNKTLLIDFNKAYNPYCAYNHSYSCPIPPKENDLNIRIEAGVKFESKD